MKLIDLSKGGHTYKLSIIRCECELDAVSSRAALRKSEVSNTFSFEFAQVFEHDKMTKVNLNFDFILFNMIFNNIKNKK